LCVGRSGGAPEERYSSSERAVRLIGANGARKSNNETMNPARVASSATGSTSRWADSPSALQRKWESNQKNLVGKARAQRQSRHPSVHEQLVPSADPSGLVVHANPPCYKTRAEPSMRRCGHLIISAPTTQGKPMSMRIFGPAGSVSTAKSVSSFRAAARTTGGAG